MNSKFLVGSLRRSSAIIAKGFSLVELILYSAITLILFNAALSISLSQSRSSIKTYELAALRNQMARITFLLEGELAEGEQITVCNANCPAVNGQNVAYSLQVTHPHAADRAAITNSDVTYYGTADSPHLFRFGPPFTTATTDVNPANGNLAFGSGALTAAAANVESVASPNTTLSNLSVNAGEGHTLTYSVTITTGTTDRDSPWASTLTATNQRARTRVFAF
jgi:hypothetical protein